MGWFKRNIGLEWFDVFIQAVVTAMAMAFFGIEGDGELIPVVVAVSFVVLGVRRHFALRRGAAEPEGLTSGQMATLRLEELEQRLAELEQAHAGIAELEDRLDFAERLLSRPSAEPARVPEKNRRG